MIKIAGIAFCALVLNIFLKQYVKEFSLFITLGAVILIFLTAADDIKEISDELKTLGQSVSSAASYIKIIFKVLAASLVSQLVSDLCRDNGENALANQTELAGKIVILVMAFPLFNVIINIVTGLLK